MSTKDPKGDAELGAVGAIPTSGSYYRLDVTTTSASITNLPAGRYIVRLSNVDLVALDEAAVTEPASGSTGNGGVFASGDQLNWRSTATIHCAVLNAGSGRLYLTPAP